jgi:hypothetical protein
MNGEVSLIENENVNLATLGTATFRAEAWTPRSDCCPSPNKTFF